MRFLLVCLVVTLALPLSASAGAACGGAFDLSVCYSHHQNAYRGCDSTGCSEGTSGGTSILVFTPTYVPGDASVDGSQAGVALDRDSRCTGPTFDQETCQSGYNETVSLGAAGTPAGGSAGVEWTDHPDGSRQCDVVTPVASPHVSDTTTCLLLPPGPILAFEALETAESVGSSLGILP